MKKLGTEFEFKIIDLLKELEFNDIDGARDNFLINGIQVDACAGWENALLVIECKTQVELKTKNLRHIISDFRGKIPLLKKGFNNHKVYGKYEHFQFILVTHNIEVRKEDIDYANQYPRIYIWNDNLLEYYNDLYGSLKPYAKYSLLGEMGIKPLKSKPIRVPAIRTSFGKVNLYSFLINPKELLEVSFVARREVGDERYYQRIINKNRINQISKYIESGGQFANNIIIAFEKSKGVKFYQENKDDWPFKEISYGILEFPKDYRSCWIIDGQHRLFSFSNLEKDFYFNMPVTAFEHLEVEKQKKFFLDINKNQKPVDSDLLWDLSSDVTEKEGLISAIVKKLNKDNVGAYDKSPLWHHIYYPSLGVQEKTGLIKISALCIALKKNKVTESISQDNIKNPLYNEDYNKHLNSISKSLKLYFWAVKNVFPLDWEKGTKGYVLSNGGIAVIIGIFMKIISRIMQRNSREPRQQEFEEYLRPLSAYIENITPGDLKKLRVSCSSEAGRKEVLDSFCIKIRLGLKDELFGGNIETIKFNDEFLGLESRLKKLIKEKLGDGTENWFEKNVDKDIYQEASNRLKKNGINDIGKIYLQITLGQVFRIIRTKKDIFYPIFTSEGNDSSFSNDRILEAAFDIINTMRAKLVAHDTGAKIKTHDEEILELNLRKINNCLDLYFGASHQ